MSPYCCYCDKGATHHTELRNHETGEVIDTRHYCSKHIPRYRWYHLPFRICSWIFDKVWGWL
jgi:hypothetical protein